MVFAYGLHPVSVRHLASGTTSKSSAQKKKGMSLFILKASTTYLWGPGPSRLKFTIPGLKNRAGRTTGMFTISEQIGIDDLFVAMPPPPITRSHTAILPSRQNTQDDNENFSDQD